MGTVVAKKPDFQDEPGVVVTLTDIEKGIHKPNGELMFPNYDTQLFPTGRYVHLNAETCVKPLVANFFVNFAVVATDAGTTKKFLDAAGSMLTLSPSGLTPITVINQFGKVIDTVEKAIGQTDVTGHQEFSFPVKRCCHKGTQSFTVKLSIDTHWMITDTSSDSDYVQLDVLLRAFTARDSKSYRLTGTKAGSAAGQPYTIDLECTFLATTDFEVFVSMDEHCLAGWSPNPKPWISMIKFDHMLITVTPPDTCEDPPVPVAHGPHAPGN